MKHIYLKVITNVWLLESLCIFSNKKTPHFIWQMKHFDIISKWGEQLF